ncbi:hypothetical protein HWV62_570 [Athelia sp. TMB]|nr:hypothetical protein HWV62_570 [Athelia sp. TMB]
MSLRCLSIILPLSLPSLGSALQLLSTLKDMTPLLEYLDVRGPFHGANAVFRAASSLPNLDTFYTEEFAIPKSSLFLLAPLDRLRRLSLVLDIDTQLIDPTAHNAPAFHSLEVIHLDTTAPSYATVFILKFLTGSPVREFTLKSTHSFNQEDVTHLTSAMTQAFSRDAMTTIRVWCSETAGAPLGGLPHLLDVGALRKLFVFHHLKVFTFNVPMLYGAVDDELIGELSARWPALRELSLVPTGRTPCPTIGLTLEGLLHFTNNRHLTRLDLQFNGSNCNRWPDLPPAGGSPCPSLRHLDVHASTFNMQDLEIVAGLMSDLFPNLEDGIKFLKPSIEAHTAFGRASLWPSVSYLYHAFVNIRRQERFAMTRAAPS